MYFEDADFCLRAHRAGWRLAVAPDTAILHKEGGTVKSRTALLERIVTISALTFLTRHAHIPPVAQAVYLLLRLGKSIRLRDWASFRAVLQGVNDWYNNRITPFRH